MQGFANFVSQWWRYLWTTLRRWYRLRIYKHGTWFCGSFNDFNQKIVSSVKVSKIGWQEDVRPPPHRPQQVSFNVAITVHDIGYAAMHQRRWWRRRRPACHYRRSLGRSAFAEKFFPILRIFGQARKRAQRILWSCKALELRKKFAYIVLLRSTSHSVFQMLWKQK